MGQIRGMAADFTPDRPHPRSAAFQVQGLRLALSALWWEIVYASKLDVLVAWMGQKLEALLEPEG